MGQIRLLRGVRAAVLLAVVVSIAAAASVAQAGADKITICHRVGGPNYVAITVAPAAVVSGHGAHHPLDIIPAFSARQGNRVLTFPGQNVTEEGLAVLANGCVAPTPAVPTSVPQGIVIPTDGGTPLPGGGEAPQPIAYCHWIEPGSYRHGVALASEILGLHGDDRNDIIPAFSWVGPLGVVTFAGRNLSESGADILAADCQTAAQRETPDPGKPFIAATKTVRDVNGGAAEPGDLLEFSIAVQNTGTAVARGVRLTDAIPAGTTYVEGSATGDGAVVDVVDGFLVAHLGTGATASAGGRLIVGERAFVRFLVRISAGLPAGSTVVNTGRVLIGEPGRTPTETETNTVRVPVDPPPVVPVVVDPPEPLPTIDPGGEVPLIVVVTPVDKTTEIRACANVQTPPPPGPTGYRPIGTSTGGCSKPTKAPAGRPTRVRVTVRVSRSAGGRCIAVTTSVRAAGSTPIQRTARQCVRAPQPEPITG